MYNIEAHLIFKKHCLRFRFGIGEISANLTTKTIYYWKKVQLKQKEKTQENLTMFSAYMNATNTT